jgi:chromosome segregation ATPase
MSRAATAVRSATRIGAEHADVERADESVAAVQQKIDDLKAQLDAELKTLSAQLDPASIQLRKVQVSPRKSDTAIGEVALAWVPWRTGADGFPAPAF